MNTTPWYKQFWPWFIIVIPVCAMISSFTLINLALKDKPSLVIDDYYKEGKAINLELSKYRAAETLKLAGVLTIQDGMARFKFTAGNIDPTYPLQLSFYHATKSANDFVVKPTANAKGEYVAEVPQLLDGRWSLVVEPYDLVWKMHVDLIVPKISEYNINAGY